MSDRVKFTLECEMDKRWVDSFLSFLMAMQTKTVIGGSGVLGFYVDGNGDFKPTFDFGKLGFDFNYKNATYVYIYKRYGGGPSSIPCWGEDIATQDGKEEDNEQ